MESLHFQLFCVIMLKLEYLGVNHTSMVYLIVMPSKIKLEYLTMRKIVFIIMYFDL